MTVSREAAMILAADSKRSAAMLVPAGFVAALMLFASAAVLADEPVDRTYYLSDSSTERTPAKTSFPTYPRIARRDRIEGDCTVCFRISIDGRIHAVKVKHYSHRIFRRPALRAIKASSFEPIRPNELLQTSRTCRTYRFRLEPLVADTQAPGGTDPR